MHLRGKMGSHTDSNLFTIVDFYVEWETYEQARRYLRQTPNYNKEEGLSVFLNAAFALLEGNVPEALRDFGNLIQHRTLSLPAFTGQLCARRRQYPQDNAAISKLRTSIEDLRSSADLESMHLSAWLCYHDGDYNQAQMLLEGAAALADAGNQPEVLVVQVQTLSALVDIKVNGPTDNGKAMLDVIRAKSPGSTGARLAVIEWYVLKDDMDNAQAELKSLGALADRLLPVRMMAAKVQLLLRNWNGAAMAIDKCLTLDPQSLPAHLLNIVSALFSKVPADKDLGKQVIALLSRIQKSEPRNGTLWAKYVRLFSRAMIGDPPVVEKCLSMIQEALAFAPHDSAVLHECAEQYLLRKRYEEARSQFEKVMPYDGYFARALIGSTKTHMGVGQFKEALDLINRLKQEFAVAAGEPSQQYKTVLPLKDEISLLEAQISVDEKERREKLLKLVRSRTHSIVKSPVDVSYVMSVDPVFIGQLVREIISYCLSEITKTAVESPLISQSTELLKLLNNTLPNSTEAAILLARILISRQEMKTAETILTSLIDSEKFGQDSEAFLVLTDVFLRQKLFNKAKTSLERAIANSFSVKDKLEYVVLQARLLEAIGQSDQAVEALRAAMERPGIRQLTSHQYYAVQDRCSIFLQLLSVFCIMRNFKEAKKVLDEAEVLFADTSQRVRVKLARVKYLSLVDPNSSDIPAVLLSVDPSAEDHYYRAQEKLGGYYLKVGNQKEYMAVHERLFSQMGGNAEASVQLGHACLKVNKVDKAIETLRTALRREPNNQMLDAAMGSFYTRCHMFSNALNYYEAAVKKGNKGLRMEYAKLLVKLERFDRAEAVLRETIEDKEQADVVKVRAALLLTSVYAATETDVDERVRVLKDAYSRIESLQSRSRSGGVDSVLEVAELHSQVLNSLAAAYLTKRDPNQAISLLKHALTTVPAIDSPSILCHLSSAYLQSSDVNEAYRTIREAQKLQPDLSEVLRISADIAIRRKDFDHAVSLYRDFLAKYPDDFPVIAEVTPWLAKLGSVQVIRKHLDDISTSVAVRQSPGYSICEGLCLRYSGDIVSATRILKTVMQGKSQYSPFAGKALLEMLCNYDFELAGSQSLPSSSGTVTQDLAKKCEEILQNMGNSLRKSSPEDMALLNLAAVYTADEVKLQALIDQHKDSASSEDLPPATGFVLASAYLLLGSKEEGVAVLRRFEKTSWNKKDAEYLERMWLLLADRLDITNRGDEVGQLIFRAIEFNRASYLTNMYEGFHCGSSNHAKAAECFRRAMDATGGRDFVSGERYVWSQLNAHRPMEAIDGLAALERSCEAVSQGMKHSGSNAMTTVHMLRRRALAGLALRPEESGGKPDGGSIRRQSRMITT